MEGAVPTPLALSLIAQADPGGALSSIVLPAILMLGIAYVLMIRPQQAEQKKLQTLLAGLKKGDEVVTTGGLIGRIDKIAGGVVWLDLGTTKIRVLKTQVAGLYAPVVETDAKAETKADAKPDSKTDSKADPASTEKK
jgi:preprotein translocase subunit YajC